MLSTNPLVSVVLPFYNSGRELCLAIESIINQTFADWELILVNNNAPTAILKIVQEQIASDGRIRLINEEKQGIAHALNAGLRMARGAYIARMDADDYSYPVRLQQQVDFLKMNPGFDVVSAMAFFSSSIEACQGYQLFVDWQNDIISHDAHFLSRFIEAPLAHPTVMFKKDLIDKYGFYSTDDVPEDYELWLRWFEKGVVFYKIPILLLKWHDHLGRLSRNHENYSKEAFYNIKCLYLARWLMSSVHTNKKVVICGTSKICRKRASMLEEYGLKIHGYTDVKVCRNKNINFIPYKDITKPKDILLVNFISKRGVGKAIRKHFSELGFVEGCDFILAG